LGRVKLVRMRVVIRMGMRMVRAEFGSGITRGRSTMGLMEGTEEELAAVASTTLLLLLLQILVVLVETNKGIDKQGAD
jgi:hypothetical protein